MAESSLCAVGDISTKKSVYRRAEMGEWGNKSAAVAGKTLSATKAGDHRWDLSHLLRPGLETEDRGQLSAGQAHRGSAPWVGVAESCSAEEGFAESWFTQRLFLLCPSNLIT